MVQLLALLLNFHCCSSTTVTAKTLRPIYLIILIQVLWKNQRMYFHIPEPTKQIKQIHDADVRTTFKNVNLHGMTHMIIE